MRFAQRMLQHCATYRMRYYWDRWKHTDKLERIADTVNVSQLRASDAFNRCVYYRLKEKLS